MTPISMHLHLHLVILFTSIYSAPKLVYLKFVNKSTPSTLRKRLVYLKFVNKSTPSTLSGDWIMRHLNPCPKFGLKKGVYGLIFLFAILALAFSIITISRFHSQTSSSSFFTTTTSSFTGYLYANNRQQEETDASKLMDTVIKKLVQQIKELRELTSADSEQQESDIKKERLKYNSFLTEILSLMGKIKAGSLQHQEIKNTAAHPLSRSKENSNEVIDFFLIEEIRKYARIKPNRLGKQNFMGANGTFTSIGHACFSMKEELEEYMDYDVGDFCKDDWKLAQKLMVHGCDPLPRRRCFSRAPKLYTKPLPINESLWNLPDDRNVRWSQYRCKNFACLTRNAPGKGFFKCADCFNLTHHEKPRWIEPIYIDPTLNLTADFLIEEVLNIKPGEIRIGLDFSVGTGTFAARMREFNVTIVSATINLGAPFSEMIALRGLLPLYFTINQRLPFFDNTLDVIHTTRFLDGWIDFVLLDFVLFDWDRVLRPGGLLWIDSFFCLEKDLEDYLDAFKMLRYKMHKWVVVPKIDKDGPEVFFSAVLEKPPRPF